MIRGVRAFGSNFCGIGKLRAQNIAAKVILLTVLVLQLRQVINGFWSLSIMVLVGVPVTVAWVVLERRLGAERMRDKA